MRSSLSQARSERFECGENNLSFGFVDYSNDADRSRVKSRAIIRKALSNGKAMLKAPLIAQHAKR